MMSLLILDTSSTYFFFLGEKLREVNLIHKMVRTSDGYEIYTLEKGNIVKHKINIDEINVKTTRLKTGYLGKYTLKGYGRKTDIIRDEYDNDSDYYENVEDYDYREFKGSFSSTNILEIEIPENFKYSDPYEVENLSIGDFVYKTNMAYGNIEKVVFKDNYYQIYSYKNNRHNLYKIKNCDYIKIKIEYKDIKKGTFSFQVEETASGKSVAAAKGQYLKMTLPLDFKIEYN